MQSRSDRTKGQLYGLWPWKEDLFLAGPVTAYLTVFSAKVSLVNSSMSAAVPTNKRRSSESWSRVIVPPIGRSHLPIISINRNVWWSPKVQSFSHTVDKLFTNTLACVTEMPYRRKDYRLPPWETYFLHHGFQSRANFCGRLLSEDDSSLTEERNSFHWTLWKILKSWCGPWNEKLYN